MISHSAQENLSHLQLENSMETWTLQEGSFLGSPQNMVTKNTGYPITPPSKP
jgi:hypothetical protein